MSATSIDLLAKLAAQQVQNALQAPTPVSTPPSQNTPIAQPQPIKTASWLTEGARSWFKPKQPEMTMTKDVKPQQQNFSKSNETPFWQNKGLDKGKANTYSQPHTNQNFNNYSQPYTNQSAQQQLQTQQIHRAQGQVQALGYMHLA